MQLQEQNQATLTLITLNVDFDQSTGDPDGKLVEQVAAVLQENKMTCENLMSTTSTESVLAEFELFRLPAALVFDAEGKLARSFDGDTEGLRAEVVRLAGGTVALD